MKVTSAEANKMLRKLQEDHRALEAQEEAGRTFVAATTENLEDARPEYNYAETQKKLAEIERKTRVIKHAINVFNVTQTLGEGGMTIDQALVCIPQLSERKRKLSFMRTLPKKKRNEGAKGSNLIEYTYLNYELEQAEKDCEAAGDELARLQNALDLVNSTVYFEIDL